MVELEARGGGAVGEGRAGVGGGRPLAAGTAARRRDRQGEGEGEEIGAAAAHEERLAGGGKTVHPAPAPRVCQNRAIVDGPSTRRTLVLRALALAAATVVLAAGPLGGAEESAPEEAWFVSRYNEIIPVWLPEREADIQPQDWPPMLIYEVTRFPDAEATPAQRRAADDLLARSWEAARRNGWTDFEKARADGFDDMSTDRAHFANREFIADDRVLDPDRPEFLLFFDTEKGKKLASFMYLVAAPEDRGPQVGGPLTVWHYHTWATELCLWKRLLVLGPPGADGECAEGEPMRRSPEMLHVWFIDRPGGRFATDMQLEPHVIKKLADLH